MIDERHIGRNVLVNGRNGVLCGRNEWSAAFDMWDVAIDGYLYLFNARVIELAKIKPLPLPG
jgi:hypothetical protein